MTPQQQQLAIMNLARHSPGGNFDASVGPLNWSAMTTPVSKPFAPDGTHAGMPGGTGLVPIQDQSAAARLVLEKEKLEKENKELNEQLLNIRQLPGQKGSAALSDKLFKNIKLLDEIEESLKALRLHAGRDLDKAAGKTGGQKSQFDSVQEAYNNSLRAIALRDNPKATKEQREYYSGVASYWTGEYRSRQKTYQDTRNITPDIMGQLHPPKFDTVTTTFQQYNKSVQEGFSGMGAMFLSSKAFFDAELRKLQSEVSQLKNRVNNNRPTN